MTALDYPAPVLAPGWSTDFSAVPATSRDEHGPRVPLLFADGRVRHGCFFEGNAWKLLHSFPESTTVFMIDAVAWFAVPSPDAPADVTQEFLP